MKDLKGKKLLVLGGNYSTVNLVQLAHRNGIYVIVTSNTEGGQAKDIADECAIISSDDYDNMVSYIKEKQIDGVMTGASEYHNLNMIRICAQAGLPVCVTEDIWNLCQDKRNFKDLCKKYNVPGVPEFSINDELSSEDFPVIVKPIDGCSSRGINICRNRDELIVAKKTALEASPTSSILIERYIDNGGITNMVKYVAIDGEYYIEAMGDRYVLNGGLITANTFYPSKYLENWINNNHPYVIDMLRSIGFMNGIIAFQTIPDKGNIYVYECCLRLTGGMTYKMTSATSGNDSMEMLLNYALTGSMCDKEDIKKIDPYFKGKLGSSFAIPLRPGTIAEIRGEEQIRSISNIVDYTHYYEIGDTITQKNQNTLDQLYARIMVVANNQNDLFITLLSIRNNLSIIDTNGKEMIIWDTFNKIYKEYGDNK